MDLLIHYVLPFVGILLGVIVVHEGGHYVTAKMFGVKVLEAGVGLPPRLWGFRWHDTDYTINALPIGAFVRMLGEEDPSDPQSLAAQPKWKRTIIIGSGAFMNLVLAIVLFVVALMIPHTVSAGGAQIATVAPGSPAALAELSPPVDPQGLQPGDQIYAVNGRRAENTGDASYFIHLYQGSTIDLTILRKDPRTGYLQQFTTPVYARWNPPTYSDECGVKHTQGPTGITIGAVNQLPVTSTPAERVKLEQQSEKDAATYNKQVAAGSPDWCYAGADFGFKGLSAGLCDDQLVGDAKAEAIALKQRLFPTLSDPCFVWQAPKAYEPVTKLTSQPPWEAIPNGARMSLESLILARNQIWGLVRGFGGSSPVTGPVGIAQATGEVVKQAGWLSLITLAATISMSLAVLNILPIPMVDGGRLVFILIEFLRRGRRIAPEREALVHLAGFVAMIALAAVITFFDVARIFRGDSLLR